jgi:hypothetical protein
MNSGRSISPEGTIVMLMLIASSFVIGVVLAAKFRVFVLLPMIILGAAVILLASMLHPLTETCSDIIGYAIALQFGYLLGASAHQVLMGNRSPHDGLSTGTTLAPPAR